MFAIGGNLSARGKLVKFLEGMGQDPKRWLSLSHMDSRANRRAAIQHLFPAGMTVLALKVAIQFEDLYQEMINEE